MLGSNCLFQATTLGSLIPCLAVLHGTAHAERPAAAFAVAASNASKAQSPQPQAAATRTPSQGKAPAAWDRILASRKAIDDAPAILEYKDAPMDEFLRFVADSTGKTVMTRMSQISMNKLTLFGTQPLSRRERLDRVYEAMANSNLSVIETEQVVWIDLLSEHPRSPYPALMVEAGESVEAIACNGLIVSMVLPLRDADAPTVAAQLREVAPDSATIVFDAQRNQILVRSTVGTAKALARLAKALDGPATVDEKARSQEDTKVPVREPGSRAMGWRQPLSTEAIEAMPKAEAVRVLGEIAQTRLRTDLSDEVQATLGREFAALMAHVRRASRDMR